MPHLLLSRSRTRLVAILIALAPLSVHGADSDASVRVPAAARQLLENSCVDCHADESGDGGFDASTLGADLSNPRTIATWQRVFDRVQLGEMPPRDAETLAPKARKQFLEATSDWITTTQLSEFAARGRVRARRLTTLQLERTLHDLLSIDIPLAALVPEDPRVDGFTNIASAQAMSHFQLDSHLNIVDAALDEAFARASTEESPHTKTLTAKQIARSNPNQRCREPEMLDGKAVIWSGNVTFYGRIKSTTAPKDGWYRIKVTASAMNKPKDHGVWCTVHTGFCTSGAPLMSWVGSFEATDEPTERTFEAWIPKGQMFEIRPGDGTLKRGRFKGGQVGAGEGTPQNLPGVAFHQIQIEEIHPGGDRQAVRATLFGDLKLSKQGKSNRLELDKDVTRAELHSQLNRFAHHAFRRPVSKLELQPYAELLSSVLENQGNPLEALRSSYRAILCSARFMYLVEPTSTKQENSKPSRAPLDDFAIASRLSYFLTGTMPDTELFQLARQHRLRDPKVLVSQIDRLLDNGGQQQFVTDFTAQWLDLVDINFTEPDRKLYPRFDSVVQNAMLAETHHYIDTLLSKNASVDQLVRSDFTFLNSRLARFYGIDGVTGDAMQLVKLDKGSSRGGLLAQGSILKVTANGTTTSPVLRGVWVCDRILGQPVPPPPESVPAIEPDIRGAKTIRDQLEMHRNHTECASCHSKIDPPGFALESFDAAGQWRKHYAIPGKGNRKGPPVDSSYQLSDGRPFDGFNQFRALIASEKKLLARNFAEKLLVYGTGAPIAFADRQTIEQMVDSTSDDNYGMRSLLNAVVLSPLFLSK
ncbi:hypothetical protein Pla52o_50910 [Novipirellula galeiformis]|uniref:Cytochrome c domain-containing protein n=1 Tax=Novipirellula galeiformis TaxID=2528004 RepID=A0A5C6C029_9BACT|nr:hypothetical protein Pla52o_50910 [Novipirellula galeiformis]